MSDQQEQCNHAPHMLKKLGVGDFPYECSGCGHKFTLLLAATESKAEGGQILSRIELCQNCHQSNPVWFAPNLVWNSVVTEISGILCPMCFIARAERQGFECTGWQLVPETVQQLAELPSAQGPQDWILNLSRALAGTLTPTSMYLNSLAWEAARDKLAQSIAREIRVYAPKSAPSVTSARIAEKAATYGILWVAYHACKSMDFDVVHEHKICGYCHRRGKHHKDCMVGNVVKMMKESLEAQRLREAGVRVE